MPAFLADECFSGPMLRALRSAGFDIERVADHCPGAADAEVLRTAVAQQRVLLTEDVDFGELTVRFAVPSCGVVRADLKSLDRSAQCNRIVDALTALGDRVVMALVTIEPTRTRLRRL